MTAVVRGDDAPQYSAPGGARIIGNASPSLGSRELASWRVQLDPATATPAHSHDHEEVFHIISGPIRAEVGGETLALNAGDTLIIPAGILHQVFPGEGSEDGAVEGLAVMPAGSHSITPDGTDTGVPPWLQ